MPRSLIALFLIGAFTVAHASVPIPKPPTLDARAYILLDQNSGRVLAEQRADERMEPASLTKLMTAYGVFKALKEGRLKKDEEVPISEFAWRAEGSRTFVQVGNRVPAEILIKGMIVQSGNDATIALAERVGGTEGGFVQMMNTYAKALGLKGTNFENSTGLPGPTHYTTARDVAVLSRAIIREFPEYYQWYSIKEFVWNNIKQQNRNGLLTRDPTVDGLKTGHTESAGYCLATSANRQGMRLVSVVLGSTSMRAREDASAALLNYGYTFFETVKLKGAGDVVLSPQVYKGDKELVKIGPLRDTWVTIGRGDSATLKTSATATEPLIAPLPRNKAVGELVVTSGADTVAKIPLFPLEDVKEGGFFGGLIDSAKLWMR